MVAARLGTAFRLVDKQVVTLRELLYPRRLTIHMLERSAWNLTERGVDGRTLDAKMCCSVEGPVDFVGSFF